MTLVLWGFARGACNYHPPRESRRPRVLKTEVLMRDPKSSAVELWQRLGSADFKGAAELTTGAATEEVKKEQAACEADAPPTLAFAEPRAVGRALCVPIADGDGRVARLVHRLRESVLPLSARMQRNAEAPSLVIGLLGSDAELELARRSLDAAAPPFPEFAPDSLVLLMDDVRGLWHEVHRVPWPRARR